MIGIETARVLNLINKVVNGKILPADINQFIALCRSYSKACLISEIQHGRLDLAHSLINQSQLDDFAMDCIADLFARNNVGDFFLLKRFFEPKQTELNNAPEQVIPVLRKLVASRVHQSLIALFCRVDKGGWNIWRNLSLVTKRQTQIHEFSFLGLVYMYYGNSFEHIDIPNDLNPQANAIPDELLREQLRTNMKATYGLPLALGSLLKTLRSQDSYQQFISKGVVYSVLKEILNFKYSEVEEMDSLMGPSSDPLLSGSPALEIITDEAIQLFLYRELHSKYLKKGKIDAELSQRYYEILSLYFSDLLRDGFVEKLQEYDRIVLGSDLKDNSWMLHRGRLEYIIRLGKSYIREKLESCDFLSQNKMKVYS